jgi:hypothetical protein
MVFPILGVSSNLVSFHFLISSIMNTCAAATRFTSGVESAQTEVAVKTDGTVSTGEKRKEQHIALSLRW